MRVLWISAVVLVIDQATKAAVLNLMYRHQSIPVVGDWLRLTFTENPGMAFGIQFGPPGTITVLALFATLLIAAYVWQVRHAPLSYRASLAFIFGGALGNIIDRVFYGVILGYGDLFMGRVVDFIHVSLWRGIIPQSVPLVGGTFIDLFPIWNVADMSIVLGVIGVLFLYRDFHDAEMQARYGAPADAEADATEASAPTSTDVRPAAEDATPNDATSKSTASESTASEDSTPDTADPSTDSAPAVPGAPPRNGASEDPVEPDGPSDASPPEVPVFDDTDSAEASGDAESESGTAPSDGSDDPESNDPASDDVASDEARTSSGDGSSKTG